MLRMLLLIAFFNTSNSLTMEQESRDSKVPPAVDSSQLSLPNLASNVQPATDLKDQKIIRCFQSLTACCKTRSEENERLVNPDQRDYQTVVIEREPEYEAPIRITPARLEELKQKAFEQAETLLPEHTDPVLIEKLAVSTLLDLLKAEKAILENNRRMLQKSRNRDRCGRAYDCLFKNRFWDRALNNKCVDTVMGNPYVELGSKIELAVLLTYWMGEYWVAPILAQEIAAKSLANKLKPIPLLIKAPLTYAGVVAADALDGLVLYPKYGFSLRITNIIYVCDMPVLC